MESKKQFRFGNIKYYKECPYCGSKNVEWFGSAGSDMFNTTDNYHCNDCNEFYEVEV
jgi:sarcosine oxidase delta subunit